MKRIYVIMTITIFRQKDKLFLVFTIAISVSISVPLVLSHTNHIDGILHMTIHAGGFVIASFLTIMTLISWRKTKTPRMVFSSFAFATLAVAQVVYMYLERNVHEDFTFENEIFDFLIVIVTILFAVGVFYKR